MTIRTSVLRYLSLHSEERRELNAAIANPEITSRIIRMVPARFLVSEKRGLAYSVYGYLNPYDHSALIMGGVATANARVAESLKVIRAEWQRMADHGMTAEELASTKTYINGSFPLRLDSTRRIAGMLIAVQINRLGIGYLDSRAALMNKVTSDDIKRVAKRLLKADELSVVVVGKPKGLRSTP